MRRHVGAKAAEFPFELAEVSTLTGSSHHKKVGAKLSKADEPPVEPSDGDFVIDAMKQWERWIAAALGTVLGSLGVWAVFNSSNQAGSAILLLISAAFLLIGVQGTPLIKIGGSTANVELERRRRLKETIELAKREENPEVAQGMIEAATILEPGLTLSSATQAHLYVDRVGATLRSIFENVREFPPDGPYDYSVETPMGQTAVEVKYRRTSHFRARDVANIIRGHEIEGSKIVVVTNAPLSEEVRAINGAGTFNGVPVEIVTWNDASHNALLQRAIVRGTS